METTVTKPKSVINFTNGQFAYKIVIEDNVVFIEALHSEEYLVWQTIIDHELVPKVKNELLDIKLRPNTLYEVFYKKYNGNLDKTTEVIFPTVYKNPITSIGIEIFMTFWFGEEYAVPFFIELDPKEIGFEERMTKKLVSTKTMMENMLKDARTECNNYEQLINKKLASTKIMMESMIKDVKTECNSYTINKVIEQKYNDTDLRNDIDTKCKTLQKQITQIQIDSNNMITGKQIASVKTIIEGVITNNQTTSTIKTMMESMINNAKADCYNYTDEASYDDSSLKNDIDTKHKKIQTEIAELRSDIKTVMTNNHVILVNLLNTFKAEVASKYVLKNIA